MGGILIISFLNGVVVGPWRAKRERRKGPSGDQRLIAANGAVGKPGLGLGNKFGKVGLALMGGEGGFALPHFVEHPAVGMVQVLMQLIALAAHLLQRGRDQRLKGSAKLGGEFGFGFKLGNHNHG